MISSWVDFDCVDCGYQNHHVLLLLIVDFHQIWIDSQLLKEAENGFKWRVAFQSPQELCAYRCNNVTWMIDGKEYSESSWHRHAKIASFAPLSPKFTIINYHYQRIMAKNNLWTSSISRWNVDRFIKFCDDHGIDENINPWEQWLSETNEDHQMENALEFIRFIFDDNELINHILSNDIRSNITALYGPIIVLLAKEEPDMDKVWQYLNEHFDLEVTMMTMQYCFRVNTVIGSDSNAYRQVNDNDEVRGHCDDISQDRTTTFREFCVQKRESLNKLRRITDKNANLCHQLLIKNPVNVIITTCNGIDYIISDGWKSPNRLINQQLAMKWPNASGYDFRCHTLRENKDRFIWGGEQLNTLQDAIPMNSYYMIKFKELLFLLMIMFKHRSKLHMAIHFRLII